MPTSKEGPKLLNATPVESGADLKDLLGRVLVFEPTEEATIETVRGPAEVTRAVAYALNEQTGNVEALGEVPVFWQRVRAQLKPALEAQTSVAGRLVRSGRAYTLEPLPDEVVEKLGAQLF